MSWSWSFYAAAALGYALACLSSFRYYRNLESPYDDKAAFWLKTAFLIQTAALGVKWWLDGYAPMNSLDGVFALLAFSLAGSLWIGRLKTPVPVLTSLFLPFILLLSILALLTGFHPMPIMDGRLMTTGMAGHIFLSFLGFSLFTLGFGVGVAFWVQEGQLKQHQIRSWSFRLPALEMLDRLTVFYTGLGFLAWFLGLALGAVQAYQVWDRMPFGDPKILGSLLVLAIYAVFFLLRWGLKMRGRMTMVLVMAGYLLALFTFVGVRVFLTTQHAF